MTVIPSPCTHMVGAASVIISDLVENHHPNKSWDKFAQEANKITASEYFQVMRKPQNFLKHARDDAGATLDFDPKDTESVAFWAVMNLGNFGPLTLPLFSASHSRVPEPVNRFKTLTGVHLL
jgi:hypothetical protein